MRLLFSSQGWGACARESTFDLSGIYRNVGAGVVGCDPRAADFTVSRYRDESLNPLASDNRFAFLYESASPRDPRRGRSSTSISKTARSAAWKALCEPRADDAFFLSVHPADSNDPPAERREIGHETLNFDFAPPGAAVFGEKRMASRQLPGCDIARSETVRRAPGGERMRDAELAVGD